MADELRGRMMICRRVAPLPVELIVRGYLSGSGWLDYQRTGAVSGVPLPAGLRESDRLPEPVFTPSTKARDGPRPEHRLRRPGRRSSVGPVAERARDIALAVYRAGAATRSSGASSSPTPRWSWASRPATGGDESPPRTGCCSSTSS